MTRIAKTRTVIAALAVSLTAVAGFSGVASAAGNADTKVVIKAESGGFYGYVKSSNPGLCANGRTVTLYQQLGSTQSPKTDQKIGSDTAEANGTQYMWSTGNTGSHSGNFYARAAKVPGCKAASSKTIPAQA